MMQSYPVLLKGGQWPFSNAVYWKNLLLTVTVFIVSSTISIGSVLHVQNTFIVHFNVRHNDCAY